MSPDAQPPSERFPSDQLIAQVRRLERMWLERSLSGRGLTVGWSYVKQCLQVAFKLPQSWIEAELRYETFDDVLIKGLVPIYRTACELKITRPGLFDNSVPTRDDVQHLLSRYHAYSKARGDALDLLRPLVFLPGLRSDSDPKPGKLALPLPVPSNSFSYHVYIARLAAFGKCSRGGLAEFFMNHFLKLTRAQKDEFCDEYHRPKRVRTGKYFFLAVWLADNAPVFNVFRFKWMDILTAARKRFQRNAPEGYRDCPESSESLKSFWKDHEDRLWPSQPRRITPPSGHPLGGTIQSVPDTLFTPLPFVRTPRKP